MSHMCCTYVQDFGYIQYQYDTSIATAQAAVDRNPVSKHCLWDKHVPTSMTILFSKSPGFPRAYSA